MAKQTTNSEATSTSGKRSFGWKAEEMVKERILLPDGLYAGTVKNASVVDKDGNSRLKFQKEQIWDSKAPNPKNPAKAGAFVETANYVIVGDIYFSGVLTSNKAKSILAQDEPTVTGGRLRLKFNGYNSENPEESWMFNVKNNIPFTNFVSALGIDLDAIMDAVDFDFNENLPIPEELAEIPDAIGLLNSLIFHREVFALVVKKANGSEALFKVIVEMQNNDEHNKRNTIDTGNFNSFCGILPYTANAENDLAA